MKILKIIGAVIGVIILVFVILIFAAPQEYQVERSVVIEASPASVFPHVASLKSTQAWSPWAERDTNQTVTYSGEDGTVGSMMRWEGNKEVGVGEQEITAIIPNERVESELRFIEPWESKSDSYVNLQAAEGGTSVTWGFKGSFPKPMNAFMVFMSMDKAIGTDFEEGLGKLKTLVESEPAASGEVQVNTGTYPGAQFLAIRKKIPMSDMEEMYTNSYGAIMGAMQAGGMAPQGPMAGLYYEWDEASGMTDMAPAVPVAPGDGAPAGMERIILASGPCVSVDHFGSYEALGDAHMAIEAWSEASGKETMAPAIEEYLVDPMTEPDTAKWQTRITYLVKE